MPNALFAIKPQYVEKILLREKRYEFRKTRCKRDIDTMLLYATMPIGRIVGEVSVAGVIEGEPDEVWRVANESAGLDYKTFAEYFANAKNAYAYCLGEPVLYEKPVDIRLLGLKIPQSFCYITDDVYKIIRDKAAIAF